jgi:serine/threonine-protein kinase
MGDVFLAVNVGPAGVSKLVVVKELREELARASEARTMFLDEARLATRLNHPNVVQTYEVVDEQDSLYLTMEFLDGQPLHRIIRGPERQRFPLPTLLRILADALAGLHYAHELTDYDGTPLEVVHRDVSPHNIIVTYEGTTKLVDFGIAKAADATTVTASGVFKGKVRFSAPEQALCQPIDRRTDVFAVGMVLWEMCTGEPMWRNMADAAVLLELASGRIPRARTVNPEVPAELDAICTKALALAPGSRYATANDMRVALLDYLRRTSDGGPDLTEVLTAAFAEERKRIRSTIESEIRSMRESSSASRKIRRVPELSLPPSPADPEAADTRATGVVDTRSGRDGARPTRWVAAATAGAALMVIGGLAVYATQRGQPPVSQPATGLVAASAPVVSRSALPPASVHVRIAAQPRGARITVDGVVAPANPYETDVPHDDVVHHVSATAGGFVARDMDARFDRDVSMELELSPVPSASAPPPTWGAAPMAPAANRPALGTPDPGLVPRPKRPIEEESPYKQ